MMESILLWVLFVLTLLLLAGVALVAEQVRRVARATERLAKAMTETANALYELGGKKRTAETQATERVVEDTPMIKYNGKYGGRQQ
jgi:Flp pilus assembly protein TadB